MKKISILIMSIGISLGAASQNEFTFDFYSQLDQEANVLFSPTSIKTAFAMAFEGANGETQKEFETVFDFSEDNSKFLKEIEQLKDVSEISNSVWILKNYSVLKSYRDKLKTNFDSEPYTANFKSDPEGSANKINKWIEESTNGMIKKMLKPADVEDIKMALVNAIYLKQDWKKTFDEKLTKKMDFKNLDGAKLKVDMMHTQTNYRAVDGRNEKVIEIPYKDDKTSMVIILPNKMKNYKLDDKVYTKLKNSLVNQEVILDLPKFTFETPTFELKPYLVKMGLEATFSDGADFSGMRKEKDLKIGTALHKAKIIVNEEGTEAAAATVIGIVVTSSMPSTPPPPILRIQVDKPFFYFIKDNETGSILFMGRMNSMQ
ncbi:MAG: serpin family protein [Crocinitomicaceae bacterium]|nr:serpin family protein [Crocinitomicaceae bacterium]